MTANPDPKVGRALVVWAKIGFYEITSVLTLSLAFWLAALPLVTAGAALLALFDGIRDIYAGTAPRGERNRLRRFGQSLRANFRRGLPLSVLVLFLFANTYAYLAIGWTNRNLTFLVGGVVGIYLCLVASLLVLRAAHLVSSDDLALLRAARDAGQSMRRHLDYSVLQIIVATIVVVLAFALLPAVVLLLPSSLVLLEVVFYDELSGNDPRTTLDRYTVDTA